MASFASAAAGGEEDFETLIDNSKKELRKGEYNGKKIAEYFKEIIDTRFGTNYGEEYLERIPISNPYTIEEQAFLAIVNCHGFIGGETIPAGNDVIQLSALPNRMGTVPDKNIIQAIIGKYGYPNLGLKHSIDEIKQNIRKFESLKFLNLVKNSYKNLLEIIDTIRQLLHDLSNDIIISKEDFQTEIDKLQTYFSPVENPPDIKAKIKEIYDGNIAIKIQAAQEAQEAQEAYIQEARAAFVPEASIIKAQETYIEEALAVVSQQLKENIDKVDEIKKIYEGYVLNEFAEINYRHGTYVEKYPNLKFEGRHSENPPDSMMGIFIVPYDNSPLDKCFKDTIASKEFEDFVLGEDKAFKINERDLKKKEECILRHGTLTHYILRFLSNKYLRGERADRNRYNVLFNELSRNYDQDPLTIPGKNPSGNPYQTNMTNIKHFIDYIKCFALKHKDFISDGDFKPYSEYMKKINSGAIPACVYLFTCAKCYFEGVGTVLPRVDTAGGSKTRRKKPRNKHSRNSRKRSNSLIRKVKRKPRK